MNWWMYYRYCIVCMHGSMYLCGIAPCDQISTIIHHTEDHGRYIEKGLTPGRKGASRIPRRGRSPLASSHQRCRQEVSSTSAFHLIQICVVYMIDDHHNIWGHLLDNARNTDLTDTPSFSATSSAVSPRAFNSRISSALFLAVGFRPLYLPSAFALAMPSR